MFAVTFKLPMRLTVRVYVVDAEQNGGNGPASGDVATALPCAAKTGGGCTASPAVCSDAAKPSRHLFTNATKAIVWGLQSRAVQEMLDFDYVCSRQTPSVVAMVYPLV